MPRRLLSAIIAGLILFAGCKPSPEEVLLEPSPTPAATPAPTLPPETGIVIQGRLDADLRPRTIQPARLIFLVDRSAEAAFFLESIRQSIYHLMERIPKDLPLGMRAFPAKEGDAPTEVVESLGTDNRMVLRVKTLELTSSGTGSLSRALLESSEEFLGSRGDNRIILVASPQKETAPDRDPCTVARALHRMAEKIQIDVVETIPYSPGEILPGTEEDPLPCIADNGGGRYIRVDDPSRVEAAIWSLLEDLRSDITVEVALSEGNFLEGDSARMGSIWGTRLYPIDSLTPIRTSYYFPIAWAVPAGDYNLRVWYRDLTGTVENIRIKRDSPLHLTVNLHAADLRLRVYDPLGEELIGDFEDLGCPYRWEILPSDADIVLASGCRFPIETTLWGGRYRVRIRSERYGVWEENFVAREGETTAANLTWKRGWIEIRVIDADGSEKVGYWPTCEWKVDVRLPGETTSILSWCGLPARFSVPPGQFDVLVKIGDLSLIRYDQEVIENQNTEVVFALEGPAAPVPSPTP